MGSKVVRERGRRRNRRRCLIVLTVKLGTLLKNQKSSGVAAKSIKVGRLKVPRAQTKPRGRRLCQLGLAGKGAEEETARRRKRREKR